MRVILDTNVLWHPEVLGKAKETALPVLPAVAFAERARQMLQAGRTVEELWILLRGAEVDVEPFLPDHGLRIAAHLDDLTWRRHARDAFIAGHVGPDDVLWTKNPKDFLAVGLRKEQIVAV